MKVEIRRDGDTITVDYAGTGKEETIRVIGRDGDRIEPDSAPPIESVPTERIYHDQYAPESANQEQRTSLVEWVRIHERMPTLPVARRFEDGTMAVLDGNRRLQVAQEVGLDSILVHPLNLSDWEALRYWAKDHFPSPEGESYGWHYDEEQQRAELETLLEDWDESELRRCRELDVALNRYY